jgi:hypothetical protein
LTQTFSHFNPGCLQFIHIYKFSGNGLDEPCVKFGNYYYQIIPTPTQMKHYAPIAILLLLGMLSCKKQPVKPIETLPQMNYTDLANFEITQGRWRTIDLDGDGKKDFGFKTTLVGDGVLQRDRLLFEVFSTINTYLLNNEHDETPPLSSGVKIGFTHPGFEWNEISSLTLAEKVTFASGEITWDGIWKSANHKFIPLHIKSNGQVYFGWIEVSFDRAGEKLILHRAAISREAGIEVQAGK